MRPGRTQSTAGFERVKRVGLSLPGVQATVKYDGTPVLKVDGCFMAGLAGHPSAEPDSLVVRCEIEAREWLLADAADTYYITRYYDPYPIVLARLSRLNRAALRDLLSVSYRMTLAKRRVPRQRRAGRTGP